MYRNNTSNYVKGARFEKYVAKLFQDCGMQNVQRTPHSHDGGIDIYCDCVDDSYNLVKCAVQCKNHNNTMGCWSVQNFHSALLTELGWYCGQIRGYIVVSGLFSKDAYKKVNEINTLHENIEIILIDGGKLKRLESKSRIQYEELNYVEEEYEDSEKLNYVEEEYYNREEHSILYYVIMLFMLFVMFSIIIYPLIFAVSGFVSWLPGVISDLSPIFHILHIY